MPLNPNIRPPLLARQQSDVAEFRKFNVRGAWWFNQGRTFKNLVNGLPPFENPDAATLARTGPLGRALRTSGFGSTTYPIHPRIDLSSGPTFTASMPFTFMATFTFYSLRFGGVLDQNGIFETPNGRIRIYVVPSTGISVGRNNGSQAPMGSANLFVANKTHVLVVTHPGGTGAANIWLDGKLIGNPTVTPGATVTGTNERAFWMCSGNRFEVCQGDQYFGFLAYSVLPNSEIRRLAEDPFAWFRRPVAPLFMVADAAVVLDPTSIGSSEAFGTPSLLMTLDPSSIDAGGSVSEDHAVEIILTAASVGSSEAFGTPDLLLTLTAISVESGVAFGTPTLDLILTATSISSSEAFETPEIVTILFPDSITSGVAFGVPEILGSVILDVDSVSSSIAFGTPTLELIITAASTDDHLEIGTPDVLLTLLPVSVDSGEAFGTPSLELIIYPSSIGSSVAFGIPGIGLFTPNIIHLRGHFKTRISMSGVSRTRLNLQGGSTTAIDMEGGVADGD